MNDPNCDVCGAELVQKPSGRRRKRCPDCKPARTDWDRIAQANRERRKYAEDAEHRAQDLKRRRDRYQANLGTERERSRRYYADHGGADRRAAREALAR